LDIEGLRFRWPCAAQDCVSIGRFQLQSGETVFLHGPSGCGKSTLLSLAAGVLVADEGGVRLLGRDWRALASARRDRVRADHVGYIFQQFNLLPYLSVLDNVLLPCRFSARRLARAGKDADGAMQAARDLLQRVGLGADLHRRGAAELSVGQQQRVAAARALIGRPELVIADEPTSALDAALRTTFMDTLLGACVEAGSALLFVSHDARLAARFERRVDLPSLNAAPQVEVAA
jgi:putative ABC transport system ATP-binding protein